MLAGNTRAQISTTMEDTDTSVGGKSDIEAANQSGNVTIVSNDVAESTSLHEKVRIFFAYIPQPPPSSLSHTHTFSLSLSLSFFLSLFLSFSLSLFLSFSLSLSVSLSFSWPPTE
jgi:hypothetical protein